MLYSSSLKQWDFNEYRESNRGLIRGNAALNSMNSEKLSQIKGLLKTVWKTLNKR
jgi:hypothetical protein